MTHPEPYAVGMLSLAMAAVGGLTAVALTVVAVLKSHRFLPAPRSRTIYWVGLALTLALPFAALLVTGKAMGDLAVIASFGWDAYAGGLRVVNKHGLLSDGRYLPVFWQAASGAGTVVILMFSLTPVTVWLLHFHLSRDPSQAAQLTGVVRLDDRPLPRALVAFHLELTSLDWKVIDPADRSLRRELPKSLIVKPPVSPLEKGILYVTFENQWLRLLRQTDLAEGREFFAYAVVETDEAGRYQVHDLPVRDFRVTVAADEAAAVPPEYGNPARTPLEYTPDRLGPVTRDFELRSFRGGPAPNLSKVPKVKRK